MRSGLPMGNERATRRAVPESKSLLKKSLLNGSRR
jgi:hypothetical protein